MTASYPASIKTWTPVTDAVDDVLDDHMNGAYDEIIAIETVLGVGFSPENILFGFCPRAHSVTITSSQSWTCPAGVTEVDAWLVGGGGGTNSTGGAGGGYCLMQKNITVTPGNAYPITIGAGGTTSPTAGGTTTAFGYSAAGGAVGSTSGGNGGSGGGTNRGLGGTCGANGSMGASSSHTAMQPGKGQGILGTVNPYSGVAYGAGGDGDSSNGSPAAGAANTGNGGGGKSGGYAGGSGICIIYY